MDPTSDPYYLLKASIESYIKNEVDLNQYIKGNIFATNAECYETPEEISEIFKNITAAVYIILRDKEINLGIGNNLKDAIYTDLSDAVGVDMSGEVIGFLENYGK